MFGKVTISAIIFALAVSFFVSPALAQTADVGVVESPPSVEAVREVDGEFVLHLSGEVQDGYSFYIEASFGSGSEFLCTTDPEMIGIGYQECASGDMTLSFVAPEGEEVSYRILGNPGNELSQFVVSEGTVPVSDGMVIEGSYAFPAAEVPSAPEVPVGDQYGNDEAAPVIEAEPVSMTEAPKETTEPPVETTVETTTVEVTNTEAITTDDVDVAPESNDGFLPQSGGFPLMALAGVALLVAGGFLFRKMML